MDIIEWQADFDEWDPEYGNDNLVPSTTVEVQESNDDKKESEKFPEIEIGSSSDDDAPPQPISAKLARENLSLRLQISKLQQTSKNKESMNQSLKMQLVNFRNMFKNHVNNSVFNIKK